LHQALLSRAASLGLTQQVDLLGPREDIERVLAACDLFVLSSVSEGLPNTILEAMATGLPVVSTRVGGADELVEHGRTGLLVPPSDAEAMAGALARLAAAPQERQAMGMAGRQAVERHFSLRAMTDAYEDLYLSCRRPPRPMTESATGDAPCAG
jgi:glycosyltransferase involved in cell wall biosynthesis